MNRSYPVRVVRLLLGFWLYALGIVLSVQANVGLAPWDAFHQGVAMQTGMSFGLVMQIVGFVILAIAALMGEPVGIGTVGNIFFLGFFVSLIQGWEIIPQVNSLPIGLLVMLVGQIGVGFGTYFYIEAALGSGPRDMLMRALSKRLPKVPVGAIRGMIEGSALLIGWLLGGKVGIGTVVAVFGISFILQAVFALMRFDIRALKQESIRDTLNHLVKR